MNILIHGAINGSNFGDCLFANLFYEYLSREHTVDFVKMPLFGLCDYLKNEIDGYQSKGITIYNADALLYMSGGYFGDTYGSLREALKRYIRYFLVSIPFIIQKKPIFICGVGGGPVNNKYLRNKMVKIMNRSAFLSVRDTETATYFKEYGVCVPILVTADTALSIKSRKLPSLSSTLIQQLSEKKNIFFHVYGDDSSNAELENIILPALNRFIIENQGKYRVFVGTDFKCENRVDQLHIYQALEADKIPVDYPGTWEMCAFLSRIDTVITVKLHVGIVSALYEKSVLSFPRHKSKTIRFFKQIGFPERCLLLSNVSSELVYQQLKKYSDSPIFVDDKYVLKAGENLNPIKKDRG